MIADRLAEYARSLAYKNLPAPVIHEVKRRSWTVWAARSAHGTPRLAGSLAASPSRSRFQTGPRCGAPVIRPCRT